MNINSLIREALAEDIGNGDITTNTIISKDATATAVIRAKQELVFFGHDLAKAVFSELGAHYTPIVADGTLVKNWESVARVKGPARALLTGERVALNLLMRMSGISTHTHAVVKKITTVRVVDTRKTTPLWRRWEREAVLAGGAMNHRFALYDGILIKDNHIAVAGSITEAITKAKSSAHHLLKIEIEVESISQLEEAINAGADVVMLDNMTNTQLEEAVIFNNGRVLLEASGNMTRDRIEAIQNLGLDVISMGGLIHQARWADLSMKIEIL